MCVSTECEITYINLVGKTLGDPLHPLRLLDLSDLFVAGPVVPTLLPHIDMLASVAGAPLDLIHLTVGVRLGPLLPTMVEGIIGPLPRSGTPSGAAASIGGPSTRAGDGALFSSSATLLGGGVPVPLIPYRGVYVGPFSGRFFGNLLRRRGSGRLHHGLLRGCLPHGGLPHNNWFRWPQAQNDAGVNIRGGAAKFHSRITTLEF